MGLCNCPDIFQEKIRELMADLEFVRAYTDDLIILTKHSWDNHLNQLSTVFSRQRCKPQGPCKEIILWKIRIRIFRLAFVEMMHTWLQHNANAIEHPHCCHYLHPPHHCCHVMWLAASTATAAAGCHGGSRGQMTTPTLSSHARIPMWGCNGGCCSPLKHVQHGNHHEARMQ